MFNPLLAGISPSPDCSLSLLPLQGQAVITETLLKTQQQEQQQSSETDSPGAVEVGGRQQHLSSSSSHFSEGFEIIEEEPEVELCELNHAV